MKPKAHWMNMRPFRAVVMLVVGEDAGACVRQLAAEMKVDADEYKEYLENMEREREGLLDNRDASARFCRCGRCITHGAESLLWFPTFPTAATLAHECLHAVQTMLKDRGVEDANGEIDAYLFEEMFRHFLTVLTEDAKKEFGRRTEVEP